jgi:hypothetical protein
MIDEKLNRLFEFISDNRIYNKTLQSRYYHTIIYPNKDKDEKVIALLYHIANTQSQPNINKLSQFYQKIIKHRDCLGTFKEFVNILNPNGIANYKALFDGLVAQSGWGNKTSALFCKSIYHLHNGIYDANLQIWDDAPLNIDENDKFYLPVDSVITAIFNWLEVKVWSFDTINKKLSQTYSKEQIEIWDDLWFWGFITQQTTKDGRVFGWNNSKYWALKETDKDSNKIKEIQSKCSEFIAILRMK